MLSSTTVYYICSSITTCLCTVLKIPQLYNIYKTKSSAGISIGSLLFEFWAFMTILSYSYSSNYPITLYLEYIPLVTQDSILILMILQYKNSLTLKWITIISIMIAFQTSIAFHLLPSYIATAAIQIGNPIAWYSKWLQFWTIYSKKDAGNVSALSWALYCVSGSARLTSMFLSVRDVLLMFSLSVSLILNASVAIAAHKYKPKLKVN